MSEYEYEEPIIDEDGKVIKCELCKEKSPYVEFWYKLDGELRTHTLCEGCYKILLGFDNVGIVKEYFIEEVDKEWKERSGKRKMKKTIPLGI